MQSCCKFLFGILVSILILSLPTNAQEDTVTEQPELLADLLIAEMVPPDYAEQAELIDEDVKPFNLYLGMDFASMYMSRGLVYSSKFSIQPWIEVDVPLVNGTLGKTNLSNISWFVGNWNSFQGGDAGLGQTRSGRGGVINNWYEADVYSGLRLKLLENLQTSLRFNWYTSPSDSFGGIQELDWRFTYNDSWFWKEKFGWENFATSPSLRVAKELKDQGGPEQWYFQPSFAPSFLVDTESYDFTVKFPFIFGFGANGQYRDFGGQHEHHFGFFQTGVGFNFPLNFIPENAGSLTYTANFDLIVLSDHDLSFRDDQVEYVGRMGFVYSY